MNLLRFYRSSKTMASACALASLVAIGLTISACTPNYPRCNSDSECASRGEVCLHGQCQECRDQTHCATKYPTENRTCVSGRCELESDCSQDADCAKRGLGWVCHKGHCQPECNADSDCGQGRQCVSHRCTVQCVADSECPGDGVCIEGTCSSDPNDLASHASCRPTSANEAVHLPTVTFEFNQFDLTSASREALAQVMRCLAQAPKDLSVTVEGHCDDRGTQEYNLALGEKRAQSVMRYLTTLGADAARLKVLSKGENEPTCGEATEACYAQNRRVVFAQQSGNKAH